MVYASWRAGRTSSRPAEHCVTIDPPDDTVSRRASHERDDGWLLASSFEPRRRTVTPCRGRRRCYGSLLFLVGGVRAILSRLLLQGKASSTRAAPAAVLGFVSLGFGGVLLWLPVVQRLLHFVSLYYVRNALKVCLHIQRGGGGGGWGGVLWGERSFANLGGSNGGHY